MRHQHDTGTRQGHVALVAGDGNAVARPRCGGRLSQCQVPRCRLSATTTLGCGVRQRDSVSHRSRVTCHAPARAGLSRVTQHCHGASRDNNHTLPATFSYLNQHNSGNTSSRNKKYASKFSMHNLVEEEWKQIQLDPNS